MPFLPGNKLGKGMPKGTITQKVRNREEARKMFEHQHFSIWEKIAKAQSNDAIRNYKAREYSINQIIGKPQEKIDLTTGGEKLQGIVMLPNLKDKEKDE